MAINSHLVGEDALVNHAAGLTAVGALSISPMWRMTPCSNGISM